MCHKISKQTQMNTRNTLKYKYISISQLSTTLAPKQSPRHDTILKQTQSIPSNIHTSNLNMIIRWIGKQHHYSCKHDPLLNAQHSDEKLQVKARNLLQLIVDNRVLITSNNTLQVNREKLWNIYEATNVDTTSNIT